MPAINFEHAFEVLQLSLGATLGEVKKKYSELVSPKHHAGHSTSISSTQEEIIDAYNHLQLLLKPYENLDPSEQQELLDALNTLPKNKLQLILGFYPHNSFKFYWDSKSYSQLAAYLCTTNASSAITAISNFFNHIPSCTKPQYYDENEDENSADTTVSNPWEKKHN
ncbi:hypothetical protein [Legionella cardiaca]|uniref:J domain-containing protein n=1 Tax=Legionella cardiaca TaxID=1071983 RepID=A0ABY8APT6_9GAMM|nr:hypothetical protein [Legionella cardiaca]WED42662.1 hypothetical protein PXX05_12250 [Legionella cardiaca]